MVLRDKNETTTKPPAAMNLQTVRLTEAHRIVNILQAVLLISLLCRLAPSNITTSKVLTNSYTVKGCERRLAGSLHHKTNKQRNKQQTNNRKTGIVLASWY